MTCSTFGLKCGALVAARPSSASRELSASAPNPMEPRVSISRRVNGLDLPNIDEFLQVEQRVREVAPGIGVFRAKRIQQRGGCGLLFGGGRAAERSLEH